MDLTVLVILGRPVVLKFLVFSIQLKYNWIHHWIVSIPYGGRKFHSAGMGIVIQCNITYRYLNVFSIMSLKSVSLQGRQAVILPSYIVEDFTLISRVSSCNALLCPKYSTNLQLVWFMIAKYYPANIKLHSSRNFFFFFWINAEDIWSFGSSLEWCSKAFFISWYVWNTICINT